MQALQQAVESVERDVQELGARADQSDALFAEMRDKFTGSKAPVHLCQAGRQRKRDAQVHVDDKAGVTEPRRLPRRARPRGADEDVGARLLVLPLRRLLPVSWRGSGSGRGRCSVAVYAVSTFLAYEHSRQLVALSGVDDSSIGARRRGRGGVGRRRQPGLLKTLSESGPFFASADQDKLVAWLYGANFREIFSYDPLVGFWYCVGCADGVVEDLRGARFAALTGTPGVAVAGSWLDFRRRRCEAHRREG